MNDPTGSAPIAIASDHAGFELKTVLADALRSRRLEVRDFGTDSAEPASTDRRGPLAPSKPTSTDIAQR